MASCGRNDIDEALAEAFPELDMMARLRLANALTRAAERIAFEALDQALALVPLGVRAEKAEALAARMREVLKEIDAKERE